VSTEPAADSPASGVRTAFHLDRPWRLDDRVAIRPEPFGAMLYHFGTRRLSFIKSTTLLSVLRHLTIGRRPPPRSCDENPLAGFVTP
jgi:mycofactocin biosynthesis protein MftB